MHIKKPSPGHPGFRLLERINGKNLTRRFPELDIINENLSQQLLTPERAREQVEMFRATLKKPKLVATWTTENLELAEEYWKEQGMHRPRRAPIAALNRVKWAARAVGKTDILTSSRAQLTKALSHLPVNQQRSAIAALNQLIRFKGLNKVLLAPMSKRADPVFVTLEQLYKVLEQLKKPEHRLFVATAFATGARYGEIFDMWPLSLRGATKSHVWIGSQRYRNWGEGPTKNGKTGAAIIIPELRELVRGWIDVPEETRREMRRRGEPYLEFLSAVKTALDRTDLTQHNLRHSYVWHMCRKLAKLDDICDWLRDSRSTVEFYYKGWIQSDDKMEEAAKRFG